MKGRDYVSMTDDKGFGVPHSEGRGKMNSRHEVCKDEVPCVTQNPIVWFHSYMHGGTSSLLSTVTTLVTFPVYKTVFRQQIHSTLVREAIAQLYREGPRKLYRGVVPPLLVKTLQGTLLFGLQDTFMHQFSDVHIIPPLLLPAFAGLGVGVVEALVFTPFERVQNVMQNSSNDSNLPTLRSVLSRFRSESLLSGFYRGLMPTMIRNAIGSSLYFGLKDPVQSMLRQQGLSPGASSFMSGVLNSMIISLPLYPLSVLVANIQAQVVGGPHGAWQSGVMLWNSRQRSVALLYRGGSLVIFRSCLTWGITTAIYDSLERHTFKVNNSK